MTATSESSPQYSLGTWMVLRGGLAVVFGLATVFWPREQIGSPANLNIAVTTVDVLLLAYLILHGILVLAQGLRTQSDMRMPLLGQAVVVIPGVVFLLLADATGQLRAAIAVWAVLHGLIELWIWRTRRDERMSSDFLIVGGIHVLLGAVVLAGSDMNALGVLGFTGAAAMIAGVFSLVGGYSRRSRARAEAKAGPGTEGGAETRTETRTEPGSDAHAESHAETEDS